MFEPQVVQMGPLMLPVSWLAVGVLTFGSVKAAEWRTPFRKWSKGQISSWLPTFLLIYLLAFKFTPTLIYPGAVFKNPASLLYSSGSEWSRLFGVTLAAAWLVRRLFKSSYPWPLADVIAVSTLTTTVAYNLLFLDLGQTTERFWGWPGEMYRYHPLNLYRLALLTPVLVWVLWKWPRLKPGVLFSVVFVSIGIVYTGVSFVSYSSGALYAGLTIGQWTGIGSAIVGWCANVLREKGEREG